MIDLEPFKKKIKELKDNGNYRVFNDILRERGDFPKAIWYGKYAIKNIVNWCSNDYLGMGQHKVVLDAMHTALDQTGAGSGGTRNIAGTSHYHVALENELAKLHSKQSALLFTSAYVANEWTLIALKRIIPDIVFLSDSKNHASLIQGIRHSGAEKHIFKHNDLEHLRLQLQIDRRVGGERRREVDFDEPWLEVLVDQHVEADHLEARVAVVAVAARRGDDRGLDGDQCLEHECVDLGEEGGHVGAERDAAGAA